MIAASAKRIWVAALALACAPAASSPSADASAPIDGDSSAYVTKVYELVVQYPPPMWVSLHPTPSHFQRVQKGPQFLLQQIPEDEEFPAGWTKLYGLYGAYAKLGFDAFKASAFRDAMSVCGAEHFTSQPIRDESAHWQGLMLCESTGEGLADAGWGDGVGSVALVDVQQLSNTYVRVQHIWRGARFERGDRSTWPVGESELAEMVRRFARIRLSYDPDAPSVPHPGRDHEPD